MSFSLLKEIKGCCGRKTLYYKLNKPVIKDVIEILKKFKKYKINELYLKSNILNFESENAIFIITFGKNVVEVRCRGSDKKDCENDLLEIKRFIEG